MGGFDASFLSLTASKILMYLYSWTTSISFYPIFLWTMLALSVLCFLLLSVNYWKSETSSRVPYAIFTLLILCFFSKHFISLTFTIVAFLLAFLGFGFLIFSLKKELDVKYFFLSGLILSLSFLVRSDALYGALLFSLPPLAWIGAKWLFKIRPKQFFFFAISALLLPLVVTFGIEKGLYKYSTTDQYKEFSEFNYLRGYIHELPISLEAENNKEMYKANDWSKNDFKMFRNWFFADETKFNKEKIQRVLDLNPQSSTLEKIYNITWENIEIHSKGIWDAYYLQILGLVSVSVLAILSEQFLALSIVGYNIYVFIGLVLMAEALRVPPRVAEPILLGSTVIAIIFIQLQGIKNHKKFSARALGIALCVVVTFPLIFLQWESLQAERRQILVKQRLIEEHLEKRNKLYHGKMLYVQPGFQDWLTNKDPFEPEKYKITFKTLGGGWTTYSPFFYENLKNTLGISKAREMLPALIDNEKALIEASPSFISNLARYAGENYGLRVDVQEAPEFGQNIYRLISSKGYSRSCPSLLLMVCRPSD
jgi:hypothetical protein